MFVSISTFYSKVTNKGGRYFCPKSFQCIYIDMSEIKMTGNGKAEIVWSYFRHIFNYRDVKLESS